MLKSFPFFASLFYFILSVFSIGFFSPSLLLFLSSLWAFGCTSFYHHPDFLCYLSYILKFLLILPHCLLCLAFMFLHCCYHLPVFPPIRLARHFVLYSIFLFLLVSFRFVSSLLVSSLTSSPLFFYFVPLSFFLLCHGTSSSPSSVSVSALSLSPFFFTYDQLHYHGSTIQS